MKLNKSYIETRLASLRRNPTENARLIKKWERLLRRAEKAE
jgi:hypothetical protein